MLIFPFYLLIKNLLNTFYSPDFNTLKSKLSDMSNNAILADNKDSLFEYIGMLKTEKNQTIFNKNNSLN